MTTPNDLDRQLNGFLRDGPDELPYQSFDAVRGRIEQTRQRVVIGPWRLPEMNKFFSIGLGAAAVVVALLVGSQLFGSGNGRLNVGGGSSPAASPEQTPGETGETSPSPSGAEPIDFATLPQGTRLEAGDHVFTHLDDVRVVFTATPAWERNIPNWVVWSIDDDKARVGVAAVDNVVVDPCQPELGFQDPAVGPTVDDLVTAVRAVPGLTFTTPTDVTQDGYSGVRLDYVPPDEFDECLDDMGEAILMSVDGSVPTDHGHVPAPSGDDGFSLFIYDVDGTRVVISAAYTENRRDELDAMLASIRFERP